MTNVGIQFLFGAVALCGGAIWHAQEINDLSGIEDPAKYLELLPKYDKFLARWETMHAISASLVGAFILTVGFMSIPVVGPYLALAAGGALIYDTLKVRKLKKSL